MLTQSDSGATRCCKCECHRYREPKWACSLCGRGFTRKFNVLRHLDTKHEGRGAPTPYGKYGNGQSSAEIMNLATRSAAGPKSANGISPKSRKFLALLDARTKDTVYLVRGIRIANIEKVIFIFGAVCKSCVSLIIGGYFLKNGSLTPLPSHICKCEWLLDYPDIDSRSGLVERYLDKKIGSALTEVMRPFQLYKNYIFIEFTRMDSLSRIRINCEVNEELIRRENSEEGKKGLEMLSDIYREKERAIIDDIIKNHILIDVRQFWWCSHLNKASGSIDVSPDDMLAFLQFFKGNTAKIRVKYSDDESYYKVTIIC